MMRFELVAVGKLREKWLQKGAEEYEKRLSRFARVNIMEIPDQPYPKSSGERERALRKEGEQILARLGARSFIIALDARGKSLDSMGLAALFRNKFLQGTSTVTFIIGSSLGLDREVLARADFCLSFSAFTFPHQLMRVVLLEQIYRACKINAGEIYHK
jgi:23S rRNA (pseudouridine1915-N3)-methyltransferase